MTGRFLVESGNSLWGRGGDWTLYIVFGVALKDKSFVGGNIQRWRISGFRGRFRKCNIKREIY